MFFAVAALGAQALTADGAHASTKPGVNATPYNHTDHWWVDDGCSAVADRGMAYNFYKTDSGDWRQGGAYFSFGHACVHHDGCYRHHWGSRATCDSWFLNDMNASCDAMYPHSGKRRSVCRAEAWKYYAGVRMFGWPAYNSESIMAPLKYVAT